MFAAVDQGDLAMAGNTLMTCNVDTTGCADARANLNVNKPDNNNWDMQYVDVDGDVDTFNSSSSTLTLPTDAEVLYAGLRWSGDSSTDSLGDRLQVQLTDPAGLTSTVIAKTVVALDASRFISLADVTAL